MSRASYEETLKYNKEYYAWKKEHSICVYCGNETAEPGRTMCFKCAEKNRARASMHRQENIEKKRQSDRERYNRLKSEGVCPYCRKRPPADGHVYCAVCRGMINQRSDKRRRENGIMPEDMRGNGVYCYVCTKEVEVAGSKVCNKCRENLKKNAAKARKHRDLKNHWWTKDNDIVFRKGVKNENSI